MAGRSATLLRYITRQAAASTRDAVLLQRFITDCDEDAFAGLVRRHGPIVYRVCRRLLGPTAAEDAFQATFLVLATRAATVRKAGSVGSWLVGVAGRVARQMHKAERRRAVRERSIAILPRGSDVDHAEAAEQSRILNEELTRLSDRLRGPVVACLLQGRTYEQAATELGGSARTVRRRLDEAKRVLRARLERRGVLPVATAGLIAAIGSADAAVPAGLGARTVAAASGFLAGGATIPAALIAKGVVTTTTTSVRTVSVLLATAAAGLTALGVGLADGKQSAPAAPGASVAAAAPAQPATALEGVAVIARPAYALENSGLVVGPPSAGAMRAVENEARYLRDAIARRWFGADWRPVAPWKLDIVGARAGEPIPPPAPGSVRIMYWRGGPTESSTQFASMIGKDSRTSGWWIDLSGPLDEVIDDQLPRELTRAVIFECFRPLNWWAHEGMSGLARTSARQALADNRCRVALAQGHGVRLTALFTLGAMPRDVETASAQAQSVVRFLLSRKAQALGVEVKGAEGRTFHPPLPEANVLNFASQGMEDVEHSWDKAAKAVYGFEDVAALETAWIEWLKGRDSHLSRPAPTLEPAAAYPPLIPPVKLP